MSSDTNKVSKVILMAGKKCLFLRRQSDGTWELPGGHLNVGEKYKQGAVREVYEETGIKLTKLKLIMKENNFRLFKAVCRYINVKLSNEHIDYAWVNYKEISKIKISHATKKNILKILDTIKSI